MSTYYLFKTTVECVDAAAKADTVCDLNSAKADAVCDLNSAAFLVLLLSMQPPLSLCRISDTIGGVGLV
jgi:hypothetical protein